MSAVTTTSETYRVPGDFVDTYLGNAWRIMRGPTTAVRVRFTGKAATIVFESQFHPTQELTPDGDGNVVLSVNVSDPMEMLPWVLGFGGEAEVLEPQTLRKAIASQAAEVVEKYFGAK